MIITLLLFCFCACWRRGRGSLAKKLRSLGLERGYASGLRLHAQSVGGVWAGEVAIHGQHFRQTTRILGVDRRMAENNLGPMVTKSRQRVVDQVLDLLTIKSALARNSVHCLGLTLCQIKGVYG